MDAVAAMEVEPALGQHWLAHTQMGFSVTRLEDVTAILRDKRFHSALSVIALGRARGLGVRRPPPAVHPLHGGRGARPPPPPRRAAFTPASANRLRPTMRGVITSSSTRCGRALRARHRRLRALPDPHHLRAAGRATRGLEALLVLGHRHLPHLQREPRGGPPADRAGGAELTSTCAPWSRSGGPTPRRPPERAHRHRGGGRPALDRGDDHAGRSRPDGGHRHHPEPAGLLHRPVRRPPRAMGAPGRAARTWPPASSRRPCGTSARCGPRHASPPRTSSTATWCSRRDACLHLARRGEPRPRVLDRPDVSISPARRHGADDVRFGHPLLPRRGAGPGRLQEALPLLARRMPELARTGKVEWKPSTLGIWGPALLPLRFERAA